MSVNHQSTILEQYLLRIPGIHAPIRHGEFEDGNWWIEFNIEINHPLAWNVVQEFAHVLNYLSINEHLPTVFMPLSPPPYLNGGPSDFLSWVIRSKKPDFTPDLCAEWLAARLPRPVEELSAWPNDN